MVPPEHFAGASYRDDSPRDFGPQIAYACWRWFQAVFRYPCSRQGSEGGRSRTRVTYNALSGRSVKSAIFDAIDILVKSYCEVESFCVVVNLAFGRLLLISGSIFQLLVYQSELFCFSFVPLL